MPWMKLDDYTKWTKQCLNQSLLYFKDKMDEYVTKLYYVVNFSVTDVLITKWKTCNCLQALYNR